MAVVLPDSPCQLYPQHVSGWPHCDTGGVRIVPGCGGRNGGFACSSFLRHSSLLSTFVSPSSSLGVTGMTGVASVTTCPVVSESVDLKNKHYYCWNSLAVWLLSATVFSNIYAYCLLQYYTTLLKLTCVANSGCTCG